MEGNHLRWMEAPASLQKWKIPIYFQALQFNFFPAAILVHLFPQQTERPEEINVLQELPIFWVPSYPYLM